MSRRPDAEHGFPAFLQTLADCDKPIVTAVNGVGIGLGLTMLLHTDVNYIAAGARLRAPFVTLGRGAGSGVELSAADRRRPATRGRAPVHGALDRCRGERRAGHLTFAVVARERLFDTALAKAAEIAANPPAAVRHTKRLLRVWRRDAIAAARQREDEAFQERLGSAENIEAIRAFFEKRQRSLGAR